jgi:hypothetical protein
MTDDRTTDFLGLPLFKRLYGFGDVATLRARMTSAFFGGLDRQAAAGALPTHPLVKLHPMTPLIVIASEFLHVVDNGDPDRNDIPSNEVMLAVMLRPTRGPVPPLFPLILFVDEPVPMVAGREFHGWPKVMSRIEWGDRTSSVKYAFFPKGARSQVEVLRLAWEGEAAFAGTLLDWCGQAWGAVARTMHFDADTVDALTQLALAPAGEVWNLRQVADLANPRRAVFSELTRFKPRLTDPTMPRALRRCELALPDEPVWSLGRRFFRGEAPKPIAAFRWEATMTVMGGESIDRW